MNEGKEFLPLLLQDWERSCVVNVIPNRLLNKNIGQKCVNILSARIVENNNFVVGLIRWNFAFNLCLKWFLFVVWANKHFFVFSNFACKQALIEAVLFYLHSDATFLSFKKKCLFYQVSKFEVAFFRYFCMQVPFFGPASRISCYDKENCFVISYNFLSNISS